MAGRTGGTNKVVWIAVGVGALALIGLFGYAVYQDRSASPTPAAPTQTRSEIPGECSPSPVKVEIQGMERVSCKEQTHLPPDIKMAYDTDPPLSGAHYGLATSPGFYRKAQPLERLVHSLEHGQVVIHYNESKLSDEGMDAVKKLTSTYKGSFDGVVAVPRADAKYALVLTAWEHALRLEQYEKERFDTFVDGFRGRGPENPVRK